ncbi:methyl-viologen-reducing hydrogenase delta subunit [Methanococcus vannielii SB]|uniref:Methyl-viologen-reducing hydrogenase delta subunit n=1 Tax=Methanococcus vannielii (strain ATCC 35089 / DSM 1224 / JCM 13029 / OCM 148 / SB) TaxID=406327 RepID=A6UNB4_METVS|nr:hydrogenase iron-sulfur subunit [Methanococcus vannielii]ABR53986.1 methyl-viologen-reducing hydrogenase delta subunit [Methanococcus vannielii SB]
MSEEWEPKIVGFCCNWCTYGGADTAGVGRMQYPPSIRIIRVMCSGRIEPSFILKAFKEGADGVFIGGCHLGDCHYDAGNYKWQRRVLMLYDMLDELGIGKERLMHEWISASEGEKFQIKMNEIYSRIKTMGPCTLKENIK